MWWISTLTYCNGSNFFFHETFATYKETGSNYENKQLAD